MTDEEKKRKNELLKKTFAKQNKKSSNRMRLRQALLDRRKRERSK